MKRTLIVVLMAFSMLSITPADAQVSGYYYDDYGRFVPVVRRQPVAQAAPGIGARFNERFYNNPVPYFRNNYRRPLAQIVQGVAFGASELFYNGYQLPYRNNGFYQTSPYVAPGYRNGSNVTIIQLPTIIINKRRWNNGY